MHPVAGFLIALSFLIFSVWLTAIHGDRSENSVKYQAACLDGIFSGEVEKRGDRYYYNDKQIWLPLSQCVLEEK